MLELRSLRTAAVLVAFAGLLPSCSGNGNDDERVNFGINGSGTCSEMTVDVDLAGAFAELAHHSDDSVDCAASALIESRCNVRFAEIASGQTLRVTIDGCTILPTTGLFACNFSKVDT